VSRLRGRKGREGENKEGTTTVLTVLFGPIGVLKHGKNVDIPAGDTASRLGGPGHLAPPHEVHRARSH
jgi:hypothetical protein